MLRRSLLLAAAALGLVAPAAAATPPRVSIAGFTPGWPTISYCEGSAWLCDADDPELVLDVAANDPVPPEDPVRISMRLFRWQVTGAYYAPSAGDRTAGALDLSSGRHTVHLSDFTGGPDCDPANGRLCALMISGVHVLELTPSRPPGNGADRTGLPRYRSFFVGGTTIPR